jgi:uncharacterized protein
MKIIAASFCAVLLAAGVWAASAVPIFNATLTVGKEHRFVLVDAEGKASSFLRLGESFAGYLLKGYDPVSGLLELERDGQRVRVALVADVATAHASPATLADAEAVMTAMNFDRMIEKMLEQSKRAQLGMVNQMMGQAARTETDKAALMDLQKRLLDEVLGALKPEEMKQDMVKIYSELFTKEELSGLAAFYQTPLGQKLNDRQPEVQERLNAAIMPRIMAVMPKVRKISEEFAAEQRAKREAAAGAAKPAPAPPQ